jgi:uncharacterized protein (DUF1778 family)
MKRVNLRLDVTEDERDLIRKAAALGGFRSMAEFCRSVVMGETQYIVNMVPKRNDSQKDSPPQSSPKRKR